MKWSNANPEWEREQREKYGWGGTDSIWTGKFLVGIIIMACAITAIEMAVFKSLFNWDPNKSIIPLALWAVIVILWTAFSDRPSRQRRVSDQNLLERHNAAVRALDQSAADAPATLNIRIEVVSGTPGALSAKAHVLPFDRKSIS